MFDESVMDGPALEAPTDSETPTSEPRAAADAIDTPAPLNQDDIAAIVLDFKSQLVLWQTETNSSYTAIEAKLWRERAMGALLMTLKDAGLLDKGGRPSKTKT